MEFYKNILLYNIMRKFYFVINIIFIYYIIPAKFAIREWRSGELSLNSRLRVIR